MKKVEKACPVPRRRSYYVKHPRYGNQPRVTGLNVDKQAIEVHVRAYTEEELASLFKAGGLHGVDPAHVGFLIPGTAIVADPSRQHGSSMLNSHYYDIERKCRDCSRPFLFFAEEQRHWYEELGFPVDADCIRCHPCRRACQDLDWIVQRYEKLLQLKEPSPDMQAELADHRISLVHAGRFHVRQLEQVRAFLSRHPDHPKSDDIRRRLATIE